MIQSSLYMWIYPLSLQIPSRQSSLSEFSGTFLHKDNDIIDHNNQHINNL